MCLPHSPPQPTSFPTCPSSTLYVPDCRTHRHYRYHPQGFYHVETQVFEMTNGTDPAPRYIICSAEYVLYASGLSSVQHHHHHHDRLSLTATRSPYCADSVPTLSWNWNDHRVYMGRYGDLTAPPLRTESTQVYPSSTAQAECSTSWGIQCSAVVDHQMRSGVHYILYDAV